MAPASRKARPYHHGDLAPALLKAAEDVLKRDGVEKLTLRAVAREAGVSHTAPQHHFGDLTGLLSELAAVGYIRFRDTMLEEAGDADDQMSRGRGFGRGYLRFARTNPDMFLLMFRSARLDMRRPALAQASDAAFALLAGSRGVETPEHGLTLPQAAGIAGSWAFVHGLAVLSIDRRLNHIVSALPPGTTEDDLIAAAVDGVMRRVAATEGSAGVREAPAKLPLQAR